MVTVAKFLYYCHTIYIIDCKYITIDQKNISVLLKCRERLTEFLKKRSWQKLWLNGKNGQKKCEKTIIKLKERAAKFHKSSINFGQN